MSDLPPNEPAADEPGTDLPANGAAAPASGTADPPASSGGRGWRVWASLGAIVVVVLVVVGVVVLTRSTPAYSDEDQQKFMSACTSQGGDPVRSSCTCIFEQMKARVPYDRYVAVNAELQERNQGTRTQDLQLPPDIDVIRVGCVDGNGAATGPQPGAFNDPGATSGGPKYSTPETLDNGGVTVPEGTTPRQSFGSTTR